MGTYVTNTGLKATYGSPFTLTLIEFYPLANYISVNCAVCRVGSIFSVNRCCREPRGNTISSLTLLA
ncbi:hypothetical protein XZ90_001503 [Salmonella enterica subsp. enterica]|nr:hypothetical protein [Salmonella enterica subsp. enterica serovar Coeln]EDV0068814.1 hypothetical protein [Salmonella enterica subsp. enterica serovar Litchfield]EDV1958003.1 hypothetical protein [Salmonella enterica subsp. enterica serovar Litchfield]